MPVWYIPFDEPPIAVVSPKSCPLFSASFHLLFDCSRALEYAKIRYGLFCSLLYVFTDVQLIKPRWIERPRQLELNFLSLDQNFTEIYPDISNYPLPRTVFRSPSEFKLPGFHCISSAKRQAPSAKRLLYLVSLECRRLILRTII